MTKLSALLGVVTSVEDEEAFITIADQIQHLADAMHSEDLTRILTEWDILIEITEPHLNE